MKVDDVIYEPSKDSNMSFLEVIEALASPCPVLFLSAGGFNVMDCKAPEPEWITFRHLEFLDSSFGICYRLDLQGSVNKMAESGKANIVRLV